MKAKDLIRELCYLGDTEQCGTIIYNEEEASCLERYFGTNIVVQYKDRLKDGTEYLYNFGAELRFTPVAIIIDEYENKIGLYAIE